jgi:hypothetical protein
VSSSDTDQILRASSGLSSGRYSFCSLGQHPLLGVLEPSCQTLQDLEQVHLLLVYTAVPGSETYEKLQLLSVVGTQTLG